MVKRGEGGHVVNVASASAFVSFASSIAYSASKFAVLGLSEGLREELRPHGIGVTTLCPGVVKTNILNSAIFRGEFASDRIREKFKQNVQKRGADPAKVADIILGAIEKNQNVVTVGPDAWVAYMMKRVSPLLTSYVGRKFADDLTGSTGNGEVTPAERR
jgi:short-subunit dehydrogenase